ncbi:general stress protein [Paenibacillus sp. LHD-38]|uniref:general stress protein n=1 Tax=Paenibacillus sp. LHD-38 TaxID=3072143 RepID=UPI00280FA08E|nr:general stress protein [Paenibacillus sp. LHD-38]MDQ8738495.1 general stress protein [Paenibacillus sp. LHD-38]
MARKIGIFETEQQAITAIEQLEQAGFVQGELKVLAKDSEHSRRIEAESDVHVDELRELESTSDHDGSGSFGMAAATGYAGVGTNAVYGITGYGAAPYAVGGNPFAAAILFNEDEHSSSLHALGLDDDEAQVCSKALQSGSLIVIVETDESKSLFDKEGGPDLSRLGAAEAVFRECNASIIASGA